MRPPKGSVSSIVSILPSYRSALRKTTTRGICSSEYNGNTRFFMTPTKLSFPAPLPASLHTKKADIQTQTVFANGIARSPSSISKIISDISSNSNGSPISKVKHIVHQVQLDIATQNFEITTNGPFEIRMPTNTTSSDEGDSSVNNLNSGDDSNKLLEYVRSNPHNKQGRQAIKENLRKKKERLQDEAKTAKDRDKQKRVQKSTAGGK
eukprot:Filipodium_phascolosomae@DN2370_c0_g1_i4.p1